MDAYVFWLILSLILVVIEMLTPGFAVMCFAIGAVSSAIADFIGFELFGQLVSMVIFSLLSFLLIRPIFLKYFSNNQNDIPMNADAVLGKVVRVSERIDDKSNTGRVSIDGDEWKAISLDRSIIEEGTMVEVLSRNGLVVTVKLTK